MFEKYRSSYADPARLGEVLMLIQVLAWDGYAARSEQGLVTDLGGQPRSARSWMELASQHPELFREHTTNDRVSLIARYLHRKQSEGPLERLDPETVSKLWDFAREMHDLQLTHRNRWKELIPVAVAIIGASAVIAASIISTSGNG